MKELATNRITYIIKLQKLLEAVLATPEKNEDIKKKENLSTMHYAIVSSDREAILGTLKPR